jgi:hypothetical protein
MQVSIELSGYMGKQYHMGNHFFEIAAAYAYAKRTGRRLCLPRGGAEDYVYSGFFEKCKEFVSEIDMPVAVYKEPGFAYTRIPQCEYRSLLLSGYFQSELYFSDYTDEIRRLFSPTPSIRERCEARWGSLLSERSVIVHARRGDYLKAAAYHNPLPLEYFLSAMEEMKKRILFPQFFFISDDPEYWKRVFPQSSQWSVIDEKDPEIALCFMTKFKHFILSNSTFSWWGAYLSEHTSKTIVAPKQWFGPSGPSDFSDIYTKEMILLPS